MVGASGVTPTISSLTVGEPPTTLVRGEGPPLVDGRGRHPPRRQLHGPAARVRGEPQSTASGCLHPGDQSTLARRGGASESRPETRRRQHFSSPEFRDGASATSSTSERARPTPRFPAAVGCRRRRSPGPRVAASDRPSPRRRTSVRRPIAAAPSRSLRRTREGRSPLRRSAVRPVFRPRWRARRARDWFSATAPPRAAARVGPRRAGRVHRHRTDQVRTLGVEARELRVRNRPHPSEPAETSASTSAALHRPPSVTKWSVLMASDRPFRHGRRTTSRAWRAISYSSLVGITSTATSEASGDTNVAPEIGPVVADVVHRDPEPVQARRARRPGARRCAGRRRR